MGVEHTKPTSTMKRLSVNVPPTLHKQAKILAGLEDETLGAVVTMLLKTYVAEKNAKYKDLLKGFSLE
jgi:predicted HicB family RNase H-like nuclease